MSNQQRVVAKNTTLRGSAVKAGTPVDDLDPQPSKEWLEDAKKNGLVETVTVDPEPEPEPEPEPNPEPNPNPGSGGDGDGGDGEPGFKDEHGNFIPLKSLEVPELKDIAKDSEVKGYAQMGKDKLIQAIVESSEPAEGGEQ